MQEGKVKFFNESKGFGFITDAETGKDVFVHVSALSGQIKENDEVTFEVEDDRRGPSAVNVQKIN